MQNALGCFLLIPIALILLIGFSPEVGLSSNATFFVIGLGVIALSLFFRKF